MQQVVSVREIHATCEEGDVETLKKITKDIQDQDKKSYVDFGERFLDNENNHCTILHTAARYNRVNVIDYLFSLGMSLEVEDKSMATPLMYAIMRNSGDAVAHLIKKGANVNVKDYYNNPALFKSLSNKDTSIAEMLLLAGADINVKIGSNDQTMLDDACKRGDIATCGFLLNNNAFLLRKDSDDRTCLYYALQHPKIVTLLCNRAVELHQLSKLIRIMDRDKNTVMHLAVIENCKASLRILIEKAHEFNALLAEDIVNEKGKDDQTPLHYAIINNSKDIAQELINCPLINVNAQNNKGDTPMHTAIKHGNGNLLEAVLENENSHASLKIKNNDKFTPQELAKELNVDVDHVFNGFKNHRLSVMDFVGRDTIRKYRFVVFVFYRGSWSRACKNMLEKLNHIVDDVHALNGELIGVSSESAASRNVMKSLRLSYNVIDDEKGLLAKQLGVKVSKKHSAAMTGLITLLQKHNISGIMSNIEENYPNGMAQPAIVIVRRDGQVVYRWLSTPLEKNSFGMFERIEVPHIAQLIKFCKSYAKSTNSLDFNNVIQIDSISRFIADNRETVLDNVINNAQLRDMFLKFLEKECYPQALTFVEQMAKFSKNGNPQLIYDTYVDQSSATALAIPSSLRGKFETATRDSCVDFLMELYVIVTEELRSDRLDNFITTPTFVEEGIKLLPFTFTMQMDFDDADEKTLTRGKSTPRMIREPLTSRKSKSEMDGPRLVSEGSNISNFVFNKK